MTLSAILITEDAIKSTGEKKSIEDTGAGQCPVKCSEDF